MNKYHKIIAGTFITILLGAVGSGVWQYILEPIISNSTESVLNIATLGYDSFKNNLYQEVAKGFHEESSYPISIKFNILMAIALILFFLKLFIEGKETLEVRNKLLEEQQVLYKRLESLEKGIKPVKEATVLPSLEEFKAQILDFSQNKQADYLMKLLYLFPFICMLPLSAIYVSSIRDIYVNDAISYYQKTKIIVTPYISNDDLEILDSRFSQIKSSSDYSNIIGEVHFIANKNNIILPEFQIW